MTLFPLPKNELRINLNYLCGNFERHLTLLLALRTRPILSSFFARFVPSGGLCSVTKYDPRRMQRRMTTCGTS